MEERDKAGQRTLLRGFVFKMVMAGGERGSLAEKRRVGG